MDMFAVALNLQYRIAKKYSGTFTQVKFLPKFLEHNGIHSDSLMRCFEHV